MGKDAARVLVQDLSRWDFMCVLKTESFQRSKLDVCLKL
jgi:hypothetical protein